MKIAIVDCIGLDYDGNTLTKKGIGGSESSIISISRELAKLGFAVTVYNNCKSSDASPGFYNGVEYRNLFELGSLSKRHYDVVISQRTVIPFTPPEVFDQVRQPYPREVFQPEWFEHFRDPSIHKVLWMQDTFIWGDHLLEDLVLNGHINEIFNLSDWHIAYTTNCTHGPRRIYEVLKPHIFHTRNGINRYIEEVDIAAKDPDLFVYNASVTKGMVPLIQDIWPRVKQRIPQAKLKIVGGYYDFKNEPDSPFKQQWQQLHQQVQSDPSIEFTGIIPQPEIAKLLAKASFTIYPGAYPETSGISILESVNYNTPVIGTRFGAMNETGTEFAGYYINYAIEPNVLAPWLNKEEQVNKFVDLVCNAHANKYLHQQKMYACDIVKDISTWDTIALQWAQHFSFKLNREYLLYTKEQRDKVDWINYRVHKVFERRFINPSENQNINFHNIKPEPLKQKRPSLAIIDIMGMAYDGSTLEHRGIGGSEAAVCQIAKELQKIGFDVTIYNACDEEDCTPGFYDDVLYQPLSHLGNETFDIVISSRAVTPFVPSNWNFEETLKRKINYKKLDLLRQRAKLKVVWMHDTFCQDGDHVIEDLITQGHIDEVWTLSDFHYNYFQYCAHPRLRIPEVLRNHVWITRNGMRKSNYQFDPKIKDPNLFVFNANRSKGLKPLLRSVWPKVKERIPHARLVVIGGYYNLGKAYHTNNEAQDFLDLVRPYMEDRSIEFTGIISSEKVYKWLEKASYLLYPTDQPETFSISTLEALYHNLTVISTNFGALEEVGRPNSFQINYSSVPNALKHDIDEKAQAEKLAELAYEAWTEQTLVGNCRGTELRELDIIKPIAGWDTVALEWKQHLFSKLGLYLSNSESQMAYETQKKWQNIFGRRTSTPEQWLAPRKELEKHILVISPFYNAKNYLQDCIHSVAAQMYDNYTHILVDDASTDGSYNEALSIISELPASIRHKFILVKNEENMGAVYNQIRQIRIRALPSSIVMLLDGDDKLINRPDTFNYYNKIHDDYDFTYGSCWSMADNIPLVGQPYPSEIRKQKAYKDHRFNWIVPYTHLRTFKANLLLDEGNEPFTDEQGNWFKAGGDLSIFYKALENCDPSRVYAVSDITCIYNDLNPLNDYKVNADEQNRTVNQLSKTNKTNKTNKTTMQTKKILIAIPCKNDIQAETFKSIYNLKVPEGYETEFQYFYGYAVAQVRNLIANWMVNGPYDYLFAVDHDMIFPADTLEKLLAHDKDLISGVYRQRSEHQHIELYDLNYVRLPNISANKLIRIGGCGFGCVLVKKKVFQTIEYPHFFYHESMDHTKTFSEDLDFCRKANQKGFELFADTSILCGHIGERIYYVEPTESTVPTKAYILRNPTKAISVEYAKQCAESCDRVGLPWEYYDGHYYKTPDELWYGSDLPGYQSGMQPPAASATENHFALWRKIRDNRETAIILEHDALMLHKVDLDIPHGKIISLGYKLKDISSYNSEAAGPPKEILDVDRQYGAHSYAITHKTAEMLLEQLKLKGVMVAVDNMFFIRDDEKYRSDVPVAIMSPTPAICWVRESTLDWIGGPQEINALFIDSFKAHLNPMKSKLRELKNTHSLPIEHTVWLEKLSNTFKPKVIYDIGACFLHWTDQAKRIWPDAEVVVFDAMQEVEFLYQEQKLPYVTGAALYKEDYAKLDFYENLNYPFGNSIYQENSEINPRAEELFSEESRITKTGMTLDTLREMFHFPMPDLIKLDVQGAELDVLAGAKETLQTVQGIILEAQHVEYNKNAPKFKEVVAYLDTLGFELADTICESETDGDYYFIRRYVDPTKKRLEDLRELPGIFPTSHFEFLNKELKQKGIEPKTIYDIGACVLHWTDRAKQLWPDAEYIAFEAMNECEFLYENEGIKYHCGDVLADKAGQEVIFHQNTNDPGGNSIYKENQELIRQLGYALPVDFKDIKKKTATLDQLVKQKNFPMPDLIKLDVQGSELNVLKGAKKVLQHCKYIVIELQEVDYNVGAPKLNEVEAYLNKLGFFMTEHGRFSGASNLDGDYLFVKSQ